MNFLLGVFAKKFGPMMLILAAAGGLIWFGISYSNQKETIKDQKAEIKRLNEVIMMQYKSIDSLNKVNEKAQKAAFDDSVICKKQQIDLQNLIKELKKDRDYWKDWSQKLETGEFCVEKYGLFKQKKRLVPCKQ